MLRNFRKPESTPQFFPILLHTQKEDASLHLSRKASQYFIILFIYLTKTEQKCVIAIQNNTEYSVSEVDRGHLTACGFSKQGKLSREDIIGV